MYVYGLTSPGRRIGASGVCDAPVATIEHGELAAIVSRIEQTPVRAKRRDLLRHSDVLQRAFADGPVIPLRFGTVFESERALVDDLLGERYEELVALLQRIEGLAELRVHVRFVEEAVLAEIVRDDGAVSRLRRDPAASQVALGEAVARALAARRVEAADEAVATFTGHAIDAQVEEPRDELEVLRASFLVERRDLKAFERTAERYAAGRRDRMTVELLGPMPPHSFVSLDRARA